VLVPYSKVNEAIAQIVNPLWTGALSGSHTQCNRLRDTNRHQSFSGMARAIRAAASVARHPLDPDGCLVRFWSQPMHRENGCDSDIGWRFGAKDGLMVTEWFVAQNFMRAWLRPA